MRSYRWCRRSDSKCFVRWLLCLVRSGRGSNARYIGTQIELSATWRATQELALAVSAGALGAGPFIRETGSSQTIFLASAMATFKY